MAKAFRVLGVAVSTPFFEGIVAHWLFNVERDLDTGPDAEAVLLYRFDRFPADFLFLTGLFADRQQTFGFGCSCVVELGVFASGNKYSHFIVVQLGELVEVHRGDDGLTFVEVAFSMQVRAFAYADAVKAFQPFAFFLLELVFPEDDADIAFLGVQVLDVLTDALVELQVGTEKKQALPRVRDELFEVIGHTCRIEEFCHC